MEQFAALLRTKDKQPIRYLVVDDSIFARKNLARMVESFGGRLAGEAGDGCTAITEYSRTLPDVVLMDINMPGMNGFQLCEKLVDLDANIRVCFMSGGEMNQEAIREIYPKISLGCFIKKPIGASELVERANSQLD